MSEVPADRHDEETFVVGRIAGDPLGAVIAIERIDDSENAADRVASWESDDMFTDLRVAVRTVTVSWRQVTS